jgi:putative hydrolase of the HAD superfamily
MPVRAVVFDIGGVLEITPPTGAAEKWEAALGLAPGQLHRRLRDIWAAGGVGAISEAEVHRRVGEILELDEAGVGAFMADVWNEYLGTLNTELVEYFRGLRPRYRTAILSNSFVGARERERGRYGFEELTDLIVYSHEVGRSKPDPCVYELTCDRLGVRPPETVFLDDVPAAVDGARLVGMRGVLFRDNAQATADIDALLAAPFRGTSDPR